MKEFDRSTDQFRKPLLRYAVKQGANKQDAEDLVQEALLDYFETRKVWYYEDPLPQPKLLFNILHHRVVDSLRHKSTEMRAITNFLQLSASKATTHEEEVLEHLLVDQIMETLPPFWRQVIRLRADGWKWNEISTHFDISIGTLTKQLARILARSCTVLGIECRKKEVSSDYIHECFGINKSKHREVKENEETQMPVINDFDSDASKPCPISKHPQRSSKSFSAGGGDF